jgi:hypothetical protein
MYCPICGKQQVSDQTRFCSGCGFALTGIAEVIANGGGSLQSFSSNKSKKDSSRKRGIKQGAMIMMVGCLLVTPIIALSTPFLNLSVFLLPIVAVFGFMGGLLRIIYAFMFESNEQMIELEENNQTFANPNYLNQSTSQNALPPHTSMPVSDFEMPKAGSWRDSEELQPTSVIEDTTKLLNKED